MSRTAIFLLAVLPLPLVSADESSGPTGQDGIHPNLCIVGNSRAITFALNRTVEQSSNINLQVMGTPLRGQANTFGHVRATLVPSQSHAALDMTLDATVRANTYGQRRRISVYGVTSTSVGAVTRLSIDDEGIRASPASATSSTDSVAANVCAPSKLVRRLAQRRIDSMRPQTSATASRRARTEAADELERQVREQTSEANRYYHEKLRSKAVERGIFPAWVQLSSTNDHVHLRAHVASDGQPGAAAPPPSLNDSHELRFSFQQTLPNNVAQTLLGGKVVTDQQIADFLQNVIGDVPREYRLGTHLETWSAKFAQATPMQFDFTDAKIEVVLNFRTFVRGDREHEFPIAVKTTYEPVVTRFGLSLRQRSPVSYERPDEAPVADTDDEMLAFVRRKFNALLSDELYFQAFVPPPGGAFDKLSRFKLTEARSEDGWFLAGVDLPEESVAVR